MKKILALCLVVILAVTAVTGATLAYFTDNDDSAKNTFTVGNVEIELTEPNWNAEGAEDAPEVYPGEALKKDPTVKNIGANPCFVRISATGWDALKAAKLSQNDITYRTDYVEGALGADWVKHTDGYFYYTKVLAAGEATDALFDQIVIPTDVTNGDGETGYDIDIIAQAVQAQGAKPSFAAVQAMTVAEIAAWFTTCGL